MKTYQWLLAALALVVVLLVAQLYAMRGQNAPAAAFDQQFIDMMVPHHEGAVVMGEIARARAKHPEIKQMAEAILSTQTQEIDQMKAWRQAWFGSAETPSMSQMPMVPGMGGGHATHSGTTMNMAADVEALRNAPEPFDLAFIDAMIPHHQSAIDAAKAAEKSAQRPEIKQLAAEIIAAQQREIDQMKAWRTSWYGSASEKR
jgi:uncharacterized protein (DUF305 family)